MSYYRRREMRVKCRRRRRRRTIVALMCLSILSNAQEEDVKFSGTVNLCIQFY